MFRMLHLMYTLDSYKQAIRPSILDMQRADRQTNRTKTLKALMNVMNISLGRFQMRC